MASSPSSAADPNSSRTQPPPGPSSTPLSGQLSEAQQQAVNHHQGPAVVFAGAGSGKTRVIVHRIARLIDKAGVKPYAICAVTFTNKAALEMKERALALCPKARTCLISTFHSASARWLREFAPLLGFDAQFSILDTKESDALLKRILKNLCHQHTATTTENGESSDSEDPTAVEALGVPPYRELIQKLKLNGHTVDLPYTRVLCMESTVPFAYEIYRAYQKALFRENSMDFADLLLHMLTLLRTQPQVKLTLQKRYQFYMVDEYQDVNPTQFELISHLVAPPHNLMVVGDDDQSIYSWRGADPRNIINFKNTYTHARIIHLEQNYRSSGCIIKAANALITHNKVRAPKNIWTKAAAGSPIALVEMDDGTQEAIHVCSEILKHTSTFPLHHTAIFYRTNAQSREIEDCLLNHHIPYKIYGSLRFYDRTEIKDLLSYMRLAVNTRDDSAFLRIIKTPTRGLGAKTIEVLSNLAASLSLSLFETLGYIAGHKKECTQKGLSPRIISRSEQLYHELHELHALILQSPLTDVVSLILQHVPYLQFLAKTYPDTYDDKVENVHELGAAMTTFAESDKQHTLAHWVQNVALLGSEKEHVRGVSLMTLHSAKGLEFPQVYILGCDDGLLPHGQCTGKPEEIEEERRLFYVGITRAMKKLTLTCARSRRIYQEWRRFKPSRFIDELPSECLAKNTTDGVLSSVLDLMSSSSL